MDRYMCERGGRGLGETQDNLLINHSEQLLENRQDILPSA